MTGMRKAIRCHTLILSVIAAVCALMGSLEAAGQPSETRMVWYTGRRLTQELEKPVNIVLNRATPRIVVSRLRQLHRIALLLDRRINPDREIDVQFVQASLEEALTTFAAQLDAKLVRIGSTLFIGPSASTDRLQTISHIRAEELRRLADGDAHPRTRDLLRGTTLHWDDLAEPAALLNEVAAHFQIEMPRPNAVPHDLWGRGVAADVNAPEALSLLLGQFDLMFVWQDGTQVIRIEPAPDRMTVLREHALRGIRLSDALEQIREHWPHLKADGEGRKVSLRATVGEHEAISELLSPPPADLADPALSLGPLSQRRFTLRATRAETIAVLRYLETQDIEIRYDPQQLNDAGIDLSRKITLQLEQATAEELFTRLCEPLGLDFEIDGKQVTLAPTD